MRVPKATEYAARALLDLARRHDQGPIQSGDIARHQDIPEAFLDQLLGTLRKAGLVRTRRGRQGGHTLALPADRISLAAVEAATGGAATPTDSTGEADACENVTQWVLREAWEEADQARHRVLAATSIGDLLRRQQERCAAPMYYI